MLNQLIKIQGSNLPRDLFDSENRSHELRYNPDTDSVEESIYGIPLEDISICDIENVPGVQSVERLALIGS